MLIGITAGSNRKLNAAYVNALEAAGAEVVVIAPGDDAGVAERLDGLVLSGGPDVDPALYGERPDPNLGEVDAPRDRLELHLLAIADRLAIPVLAICRGHQVLNVARGGKLVQHVAEHDRHGDGPRSSIHHEVRLEPGSHLAAAVGTSSLAVNSLHHQVVAEAAPGLLAVGRAEDGTIEAMESPDGRVLSVQCHPEELVAGQEWARRLFAHFVSSAGRQRLPD